MYGEFQNHVLETLEGIRAAGLAKLERANEWPQSDREPLLP